jgi:hypothetical protein
MTDAKSTSLQDDAPQSVSFALVDLLTPQGSSAQPIRLLHAGDLCPKCNVERLDYDGLLNLACPKCGPVQAGGCFS